jgi:choline-sulfatase
MTKRPNILIIMVDQLNGTLFADGPAPFLRVPNLRGLADRSARFANNYTASPLCAPGRAAFMSGQLPSRTGVYDNAAEFASSIPTYAHHLRAAGYATCLSGKMHFVGPDQLHGFEERLTTDIYPADFGWTPDYRKFGERIDWWYHNLGSVTGAGTAEITNQLEYDDEVCFQAVQKLYDYARSSDDPQSRPWCLTVSFTHPHDPYVARRRHWDLYEDCPELEPTVGFIPFEEQDPHSQRLYLASDYASYDIAPDHVRRARRGYFASISYLDEKTGELVDVLARTRMLDDTLILFCSDHGDMLGERGLWFKMCFFEGSVRVPLMIAGRGIEARRYDAPVSNLDIMPTLCELAGVDMEAIMPWTDGESLAPLMRGGTRRSPVLMEYAAEGSCAPLVSIRDGRHKFIHCEIDPPQLFDLAEDPHETRNLAGDPAHGELVARFSAEIGRRWDMAAFDAAVRESQARRCVVYPALRNGAYYPWDFQPLRQASERYMRNHMDLDRLEESKRFPRGE